MTVIIYMCLGYVLQCVLHGNVPKTKHIFMFYLQNVGQNHKIQIVNKSLKNVWKL
jgi:hypothetical protein